MDTKCPFGVCHSFLDLMNYAAIALLVIDGNWPGAEPVIEADCD